jgi:hypothetical protein
MPSACVNGANDAPALRQAQIGVAVSTATNVVKSSHRHGVDRARSRRIVAAVKEGRVTFQRILTHTLNSLTKIIVQVLLFGFWPHHHWTRAPDASADGDHHDHRRFPGHVVDNRQCAPIADAAPLPVLAVIGPLFGAGAFAVLLDLTKAPVFHRLAIM